MRRIGFFVRCAFFDGFKAHPPALRFAALAGEIAVLEVTEPLAVAAVTFALPSRFKRDRFVALMGPFQIES